MIYGGGFSTGGDAGILKMRFRGLDDAGAEGRVNL